VVNADGTLTFNPAANVNGPVVVTYTIADGKGGTATSTVTINITPVADTAVLGTGSGSVKEDTPAQSTASGTLSIVDPDAGEAAFQPQTNVSGTYGSFSVNRRRRLDLHPRQHQARRPGPQGRRDPQRNLHRAQRRRHHHHGQPHHHRHQRRPDANPDTATTNEDQPVTFNVLGNDTDPDGDTLTVTGATVDPAKGTSWSTPTAP
jgi:hypothetical protein